MDIKRIALALGLCAVGSAAWSQPGDYPSKPIRLVIGFAKTSSRTPVSSSRTVR